MSLPYSAPVKVHVFNRRWVLRDPINKEVFEITMNSNSIDYWKRMTTLTQFLADLMNGRKSVQYNSNTKGYEIEQHFNAPDAPKATGIPGTIAGAEQAQAERIIAEIRQSEGAPKPPITPVGVNSGAPVHEHKQSMVEKVVATMTKKRGRPKKK